MLALRIGGPRGRSRQTLKRLRAEKKSKEYTISVDVNEVVLHATVFDKKDHIVNDLKQGDFRVYEDGAPQTLTHFSHADIPVTMGIVIDDSGSMRDKRQAVNAAALIFAKTSNPQDQVFVVNFNDVYYLDTPGDFASTIEDLKSALDKIDSRGGTALRDAVIASLDHLKLGNRDKKVLLVITDGEDNASRYTLHELMTAAQKSTAVIYTIGLLGSDETSNLFKVHGGEAHRSRQSFEGTLPMRPVASRTSPSPSMRLKAPAARLPATFATSTLWSIAPPI